MFRSALVTRLNPKGLRQPPGYGVNVFALAARQALVVVDERPIISDVRQIVP
jgi:hypothetical protein